MTIEVQIVEQAGVTIENYTTLADHLKSCAQRAMQFGNDERQREPQSELATCSGDITVRVVGREESRALNLQFRHKDGATNVLSFPYHNETEHDFCLPVNEEPALGDLVICEPIVREEAQIQNKTVTDHYAHMVVHGVLHLIGFDHIKDDEAERMEALEVAVLQDLGVSNPYALDSVVNHSLSSKNSI